MNRALCLLAVLLLPVAVAYAQQPTAPTPTQLLQQALFRESRCRQALGWVGTDSNESCGASVYLLQEEVTRLRAENDALKKENAALKPPTSAPSPKEPTDAPQP